MISGMARELTGKQKLFVAEYLVDLNASAAVLRAGYKTKHPDKMGSELLGIPRVSEEIKIAMDKRSEKTKITSEVVLGELLRLARVDLSQAYDESGKLKLIHEMPEDVRRAISGVESYDEYAGRGEDREFVGIVRKVKFWDKAKALELLGRHLKLFTDKVETTGKDGKDLAPGVVVILPSEDK